MRRRPPTRPGGPQGAHAPGHNLRGPPEPGTLSWWLFEATQRLAQAGVASPRWDAQRLAAHASGIAWNDLWSRLRWRPDPGHEARLEEVLTRRANGEPLAYIIGSTEFCGITIEVGPGVLVPRHETETLVAVTLDLLDDADAPVVADVGTGSGAVAIAIARARPHAIVHATDTSEEALAYAARNARSADVHLDLHRGHLLDALPAGLRLDAIVSNPPYVPAGREDLVAPDVLREPHDAVFAGPAGDEVLRELAAAAPGRLRPGGVLVCEVGTPDQAESMVGVLDAWEERGVEDDSAGRPRVVWGRRR
jgi:release factor glutamine methyltransferase